MKIFLVIGFLLALLSLHAQDADSLRQPIEKKNLRYLLSKDTSNSVRARIDFQLDFRNSFVRDFPIDIYGGNIGLIFHDRYRIGGGYYFFSHRFSNQLLGLRTTTGLPYTDKNGVPIPITKLTARQPYFAASQSLSVNYACINFTYRFFTSRIIDLYIPLEVGYGTFTEKLSDPSGNDFDKLPKAPTATKGTFVPGQVGFMSIIKVHQWIHVLSAIGYRKTLDQTFETQNDFTNFESQFESYYYRLGLQLQIGTIWKNVRNRN